MKKYLAFFLILMLSVSASADMYSVKDPSKVKKSGDVMSGSLDMAGFSLVNSTFSYGQAAHVISRPADTILLTQFDEGTGTTSADDSGNGNTASFVGANVSWVNGKFGKAASITNANSYITFGNCANISHSSMTISMWVRQNAVLAGVTLLSKTGDSNTKSWWVGMNANRQFWFTHSTNGSNSSYGAGAVSNSGIPLGHWTMITLSYDGAVKRYYLDNYLDKQYTETTYAGAMYALATSSVNVGRLYPTGTETWQGMIDSVIISSYVWTPEEVKKAYLSGSRNYNRVENIYIPWKGEIVFESSTAARGGDYAGDPGTMSITQWADSITFKGNNISVRAPYNKQRYIDPTKNIVAINVGVLSRLENGVTGEGGSVDLRWTPTGETTGSPSITWTTSNPLAIAGAAYVTGTFSVGNNVITQSSATFQTIKVSTVNFADGTFVTTSLGMGAVGEGLLTRVPLWHGSETTTESTSFTPKSFKALALGSTIYNMAGATREIVFEVIASSAIVELYNHTTGETVSGSEMTIDTTYSSVPTTANIGSIVIPAASFPTEKNIISLRMKSTAGITAKVAEAVILMRYHKVQ